MWSKWKSRSLRMFSNIHNFWQQCGQTWNKEQSQSFPSNNSFLVIHSDHWIQGCLYNLNYLDFYHKTCSELHAKREINIKIDWIDAVSLKNVIIFCNPTNSTRTQMFRHKHCVFYMDSRVFTLLQRLSDLLKGIAKFLLNLLLYNDT